MIRRPPRSTPLYSSAASDVYKRQLRQTRRKRRRADRSQRDPPPCSDGIIHNRRDCSRVRKERPRSADLASFQYRYLRSQTPGRYVTTVPGAPLSRLHKAEQLHRPTTSHHLGIHRPQSLPETTQSTRKHRISPGQTHQAQESTRLKDPGRLAHYCQGVLLGQEIEYIKGQKTIKRAVCGIYPWLFPTHLDGRAILPGVQGLLRQTHHYRTDIHSRVCC